MQEYVETAKKSITSATKKVIKKSSEVYEVTKLSLKISSIKDDIDDEYKKIGKIIYDNYKGSEVSSDEVEKICDEIEKLKIQVKELSEQLAEVKNVAVCPNCGAEISKESSFCAKCGEKVF